MAGDLKGCAASSSRGVPRRRSCEGRKAPEGSDDHEKNVVSVSCDQAECVTPSRVRIAGRGFKREEEVAVSWVRVSHAVGWPPLASLGALTRKSHRKTGRLFFSQSAFSDDNFAPRSVHAALAALRSTNVFQNIHDLHQLPPTQKPLPPRSKSLNKMQFAMSVFLGKETKNGTNPPRKHPACFVTPYSAPSALVGINCRPLTRGKTRGI